MLKTRWLKKPPIEIDVCYAKPARSRLGGCRDRLVSAFQRSFAYQPLRFNQRASPAERPGLMGMGREPQRRHLRVSLCVPRQRGIACRGPLIEKAARFTLACQQASIRSRSTPAMASDHAGRLSSTHAT